MREGECGKEKERPILVLSEEILRGVCRQIVGIHPLLSAAVLRQFNPLVVAPEVVGVALVRQGLVEEAEEQIESLLPWSTRGILGAQAPLADAAGGVTRLLEHLGHGPVDGAQRHLRVEADVRVAGVQPSHQYAAGRHARRRTCVVLRESHAFGGHSVETRRMDELLPVASDVGIPEGVGEDVNDVGWPARNRGERRGSEKTETGEMAQVDHEWNSIQVSEPATDMVFGGSSRSSDFFCRPDGRVPFPAPLFGRLGRRLPSSRRMAETTSVGG